MRWITAALGDIQRASAENDTRTITESYTVSNVTATRTLDADTATLDDLINFVGTLVLDLKAGQVRKG